MKRIKNDSKGFTLLELLVVVLIIGILASIALPQYQMVVAKSKFATLKNITRSLGEARNRYFLIHNEYPKSVKDLDIDIEVKSESCSVNSLCRFKTSQDIRCNVWLFESSSAAAACSKNILGKKVWFYVNKDVLTPRECLVYSEDKYDKANQFCAQETGKKIGINCADDGAGQYCKYFY